MVKTKKIAKNVFLVGSGELSGSGDCLIYAIGFGKDKICLIDAGTNYADRIIENIEKTELKGRKITHLILTHCHFDHIGAAHQFKEINPNLQIIAHDWDVPAIEGKADTESLTAANWYGSDLIPVKVDRVIRNDIESINLEETKLQFYHTPGHTPGSISILLKNTDGKKILFGQDIHGPFMPQFNSNINDWAKSMKLLLSLNANILCEGHYGIYEGKDAVKKFIKSHLKQNGF